METALGLDQINFIGCYLEAEVVKTFYIAVKSTRAMAGRSDTYAAGLYYHQFRCS